MKKGILLSMLGLSLMLFTGCPYGYKYNEGKFPRDPINMDELNSAYDDYNMASPVIEGERYLYFSSNRNSGGSDFDIVGDIHHVIWYRDDGILQVDNQSQGWKDYNYVDSLLRKINTGANEYGPHSLPYTYYISTDGWFYTDVVVYSNDLAGNQDIKMVYFNGEGENPASSDGHFYGPFPVAFLNSESNDAYPAYYGPGFVQFNWGSSPAQITELLFCSDRSGNFDIYYTEKPSEISLLNFLQKDTVLPVLPIAAVNSQSDDKCPFVDGELLVFSSNRPGGIGGFDLYYSRRKDTGWSEPKNFGDRINTEYDEYRPLVVFYGEFENDLMLFSSNRPGGKGGFDLYYVGIDKMILND
ncbi:MAG: hypothetical protein RBS55_02635 [Bacteroidales bacterium]|jgi:hypothetical protein|nr:hypothetical protein [Bacteroidales bacterium]